MAEYRQLAHPPLREALVDLRLAQELPSSFLSDAATRPIDGFERTDQMWRRKVQVQMQAASPASISESLNEPFGWRYSTADGSRVVQFRLDGATFSVLRDYRSWDAMKASAQEYWRHYCRWASSVPVGRLAVRYINVLELPGPVADFDTFLTAGPRIAPELPQALTGFLNRVVIPFSTEGATAIVTQALEPPTEASIPVVLDIDVFSPCTMEPGSMDIWSKLDQLRVIKNRIFFSSVTERTLEPYK